MTNFPSIPPHFLIQAHCYKPHDTVLQLLGVIYVFLAIAIVCDEFFEAALENISGESAKPGGRSPLPQPELDQTLNHISPQAMGLVTKPNFSPFPYASVTHPFHRHNHPSLPRGSLTDNRRRWGNVPGRWVISA